MADTGNGATLTRTGFSVDIVSISVGNATIETIDTSLLTTTGFMEKISADLADGGAITVQFQMDSENTTNLYGSLGGAAVSTTLTFPIANTSNTTAATIAGTTLFTDYKPPDFENNALQLCSATFTFDGVTGPAFTAET